MLSLSEFNWKWAIQARLSLFEPSFSAAEESLTAQLHRIGLELNLGPDIMVALPFSSAPPPSVILPSTSADDINIPFFAGIIMLWALRCRLPKADVSSLLPPSSLSSSSSSSASSSLSPPAARPPSLALWLCRSRPLLIPPQLPSSCPSSLRLLPKSNLSPLHSPQFKLRSCPPLLVPFRLRRHPPWAL